jgi:hypothetical protein
MPAAAAQVTKPTRTARTTSAPRATKSPHKLPVKLPGKGAPELPAGMKRYTIALKEDATAAAAGSRAAFVRARKSAGQAFRRQLLQWLKREGLQNKVAEVGDPTAFRLMSIVTTPQLAGRLKRLAQVQDVFPDAVKVGIR